MEIFFGDVTDYKDAELTIYGQGSGKIIIDFENNDEDKIRLAIMLKAIGLKCPYLQEYVEYFNFEILQKINNGEINPFDSNLGI